MGWSVRLATVTWSVMVWPGSATNWKRGLAAGLAAGAIDHGAIGCGGAVAGEVVEGVRVVTDSPDRTVDAASTRANHRIRSRLIWPPSRARAFLSESGRGAEPPPYRSVPLLCGLLVDDYDTVMFSTLAYRPAAMNGGTSRLTGELTVNPPPPPPAAAVPRLEADPPGPKTCWLADAWVTSPIRQLGGVGGTVAGLPASVHATLAAFNSKLLAGIVWWAGVPGQAAPPAPAQLKVSLWNCAVSDQPTSVPRLSSSVIGARFPVVV